MAKREEDHLSSLTLKDFEERGFKIDPNWSGLQVLAAVACLASEKLEEEKKIEERKEKERKAVDGYWRRLAACNGLEYGSSLRSCDNSRAGQLPRVSYRNEKPYRNLVLDKYSERGKQFVAASEKPGSSSGCKKRRSTCQRRVSDWREGENVFKKAVTNSVLGKKQGVYKVATQDKLLGDAMEARIQAKQGSNKVATPAKLLGDAMKAGVPAWPEDDDNDYEEREAACRKQKQKLKRSVSRRDNTEKKDSKPKKKEKRERYIAPKETPDLPQHFREKIENLNGSKINLVTQKYLYPSDVSDHQHRLLIPFKQIISLEMFLTDDESIFFDQGNSMLVKFIEPSLEESVMTLKKWKMDKGEKGKCSLCYVLQKQWKDFKNRNALKIGDIIQLWSFRRPGDEICLAVVLVDEENNNNNDGGFEGTSSREGTDNGSSEGMGSTTTEASNPIP
ncbi:B3 domain-containing protein [Melia azedarach]|uniref:B3 domain-containing protein n=1 Tax=Melia azedarach TaxID=155640 RepID=A0ACC1YLR9_MELAZ|nr:B3 domain-containing protein [Melia azedarach]